MHNFTHTRRPTLNATSITHFLGVLAEGGRPRPLPCCRRDHESRAKDCSAVTGQVPKSVLNDVRRGGFPQRPQPPATTTTLTCLLCTFNPQAKCNAYDQVTRKLCDSWNLLGKLVSREGTIIGPRVVVRSVLVQEARTRFLGSAETKQPTTSQCGLSSEPLIMFNNISILTTSTCHASFISL